MKVDENMWSFFQNHLGYNDAEMKKFKEDPKNEKVLSKALELMDKTIVVEVVRSHGCNSQHKVGDKFYLDGAGNFISKLCPKRMCAFAFLLSGELYLACTSCSMPGLIQMICILKDSAAGCRCAMRRLG